VICALNDGYTGDGVFSPSGPEAAGTVKTLNDLFCTEYAINQADTKAGIPGILYGRYAGDNYAGGNPWILLTSALAELLYRGATEVHTSAAMTPEAYAAWAQVVELPATFDTATTAAALAGAADGVLTRLAHHVKAGGFHLTEQIDRNTGTPMAAKDLTWSYATTLKAVHARATYYAAAVEPMN
jgi:glucoamylase